MHALDQRGILAFGASRRTGVDARSIQSLSQWINNNGIDLIVNAAAECGGIGLNQRKPANLWLSTTLINAAVLEACRLCQVQKLIMLGTVCSYAANCPVPFNEDDLFHHGKPEHTNSHYGVAKLNGLLGAQAYHAQYGLNTIYLLPTNLYGPHDNFDEHTSHVIPAMIKKFHRAKLDGVDEVVCWGTGNPTREFLYAADCARAVILAAERHDVGEPINVGTGYEISIRELANKIATGVGYSGKITWDASKPDGQPRRGLDCSRAKEFGFEAETSLDDGLRNTISWYVENFDA